MNNKKWIVFIALLFTFAAVACSDREQNRTSAKAQEDTARVGKDAAATAEESSTASAFRIPPYFENPDTAGVLAPTLNPAVVPPQAQQAYTVAQNKPRMLAQLPCFCYCDRFGHRSLHDCFVTEHAVGCDVCLKEAVESDQMENQGMTPQEIRSVLVAKYHPRSN